MSNTHRQPPSPPTATAGDPDDREDASLSRALLRPILLMTPDRVVSPPSWLEHIPFAFWVVDVLRPRVFVELGTHSGNSYAAFAQAVQHLGLPSAGYAVDTWTGDPQAGFYEESVFTEWKGYHDARYSPFSTLVRTTFDDAVEHFPDRGIDLLNIDGYHTIEAVTHDFNTWLPKMSDRSVVLMHDINVRERDFGAWQAWQELRGAYPSFEFLHGHGLGVLGIGTDLPPQMEWLLRPDGVASGRANAVRRFFARAGAGIAARHRSEAAERARAIKEEGRPERAQHDLAVRELSDTVAALQDQVTQQSGALTDREERLEWVQSALDEANARLEQSAEALAWAEAAEVEIHASLEAAEACNVGSLAALAEAEADLDEMKTALTRRDAANASLQTLAMLPAFSAAAARRALAGTTARLRALAAQPRVTRVTRSRASRVAATLHAIGMTPAQLLRSPRRLTMLLRLMMRPRLFKDAHAIAQSGLFDPAYYAGVAPDTVAAGMNPLAHFVLAGGCEGRPPCQLFDSAWYLAQYPDVAAVGANPLAHYLRVAPREDRDPHPLFSASYYRSQLGDQGRGIDPLRHYVLDGAIEGRSPHPLFDPEYYMESCGGAMTGVDPFTHFLATGAAAGINPHPLFDITTYLSGVPAHERTAENPLQHYLRVGTLRGRRPHPLFDPGAYRRANPDVAAHGAEPLTHYVTAGGREGRQASPEFDSAWYQSAYPDVANTGANPLIHYLRHGWLEGRNPSARFDTRGYLARSPDVARAGVNPLVHYVESGRAEGRTCESGDVSSAAVDAPGTDRVRLRASSLERPPVAGRVIVCLSHVMPIAPRAGNEYRVHRMLTWLRRAGFIVVPVIAPADGTRPGSADVRAIADAFGNGVLCLPDGRVEYVLRDVPDVLGSLDGELTPPYATQLHEGVWRTEQDREMLRMDRSFCSDALIATVIRLQSVLGRYVLLAEYIWMSRVLPLAAPRALTIIDTIDVFSTRHDKVAQFGIHDLVVEPDAERLRLGRADVALAIQHNERETLGSLVPGLPVVTVGVDFEVSFDAAVPVGRQVLYVASDNPMNRQGIRDFLRFAWPRVRAAVPDAELLVVGGVGVAVPIAPDRVAVLGKVADLEPLYQSCRAVINPAVAGTGVKIKTLEALSRLRRVVTWPNGVDGLSPSVAALCRVVPDWYSFSEALADVLTSDTAAAFSPDERDLLAREAAPDTVYAELRRVIDCFFDEEPDVADTVTSNALP